MARAGQKSSHLINAKHSMFKRKPLADFEASGSSKLKRDLGALDLTLLGIGCIMGTGIFVLSGKAAAANAGPAVVLSFIIAALCAAFGALCYAELAAMLPVAGSAYAYAYATLGELPAFLIGWNLVLQYLAGAATVAVGWSGYATILLTHLGLSEPSALFIRAPWVVDPDLGTLISTGCYANLPAAAILLVLASFVARGIRESSRLNAAMVMIKVGVVLLFLAFALPNIDTSLWHPFLPENSGTFGHFGASGVMQGATLLFFSYLGFDAVSVAAGETKNPQRDVPIGLVASLAVCALLYVGVAAALTGLVPYHELDVSYPMALGVAATGQRWLTLVVDIGALAGLSSVLLVQIYAASRILLAMAEDGFFPGSFKRIHPKWSTPSRLTWGVALVCAVSATFLPIDLLARLTSLGTLAVFATVGVGVTILRVTQPQWPRRFRVPFGPYLVPGLCLTTSLVLMTTSQSSTCWQLLAWMGAGLALYLGSGRQRVARVRAARGS